MLSSIPLTHCRYFGSIVVDALSVSSLQPQLPQTGPNWFHAGAIDLVC